MTEPPNQQKIPPVGTIRGPYVHLGADGWVNTAHIVTIEPSINMTGVCDLTLAVTDPDTAGPLTVVAKLSAQEMLSAVIGAMRDWQRITGQEMEIGRLEVLDQQMKPGR